MKQSDWSGKSQKPVDPNAELDRMWKTLRDEDHTDSMPAVVDWLKGVRRSPKGSGGRRRGLGVWVQNRPALARVATVSVVIVVLGLACQIPVEQEMQDGYFVQWTVDGTPAVATAQLGRHDWINEGNLSISTSDRVDETTFLLWLPRSDAAHADVLRNVLVADSANRGVAVFPVGHRESRPLYEAALRIVNIEIRADQLSEAEVGEKIAAHLASQGLTGYKVDFQKSGEKMNIEITLPPE